MLAPRSCPGRVFAEEMAFTVVALILSLYDISHDCDASGNPIIPAMEQTTGSIMYVLLSDLLLCYSAVLTRACEQVSAAVHLRNHSSRYSCERACREVLCNVFSGAWECCLSVEGAVAGFGRLAYRPVSISFMTMYFWYGAYALSCFH